MDFKGLKCKNCDIPIDDKNVIWVSRDGDLHKYYRRICQKCHYVIYAKDYDKIIRIKHRKEKEIATGKPYQTNYSKDMRKSLYYSCKNRSKRFGYDFNLDLSDIVIPEYCPILKHKITPLSMYTASIDRIDNTKGYIKGNIAIISRKANIMKQDCSLEELEIFCKNASIFYKNLG